MAATGTRRGTKAAAPVVEDTEDDEFEELEDGTDEGLEELEDEEEAPAPKPKKTTKAAAAKTVDKPKFGSAELAAHVTEVTGETYDGRAVRMLLRKMAKDGQLPRVIGETRDRYSFTGPDDPTVKAVVTMVKDGTAKALKQEGLQKVKEAAEAKRALAKKAKEAAAAEEDDADDEIEEIEEEEEAPKPQIGRAHV